MEYEVTISAVERQIIAAARQRTTFRRVSSEIQGLLSHSWTFIRENPGIWNNGREGGNEGHNVAIYWDHNEPGDIEVGVQVVREFEPTPTVVCSATPSGRVARTAHYGPYRQLGSAHQAVRKWCEENGHEIALPFWEIYGDWSDDPAKLRTDVLYLLGGTK